MLVSGASKSAPRFESVAWGRKQRVAGLEHSNQKDGKLSFGEISESTAPGELGVELGESDLGESDVEMMSFPFPASRGPFWMLAPHDREGYRMSDAEQEDVHDHRCSNDPLPLHRQSSIDLQHMLRQISSCERDLMSIPALPQEEALETRGRLRATIEGMAAQSLDGGCRNVPGAMEIFHWSMAAMDRLTHSSSTSELAVPQRGGQMGCFMWVRGAVRMLWRTIG